MIYKDVTCPVCGCACEDIEVEVVNGRVSSVSGACIIGRSKFNEIGSRGRILNPMKKVGGKFKEISWEDAIREAGKILVNAKSPMLYGWSENSYEAIRIGIDIAESIRGFIDSQSSHCHGPTIIATQRTGIPTCTLGVSMNYADLIVYWGSNPMESHPRHMSKFGTYTRGMYRPRGRRDRKVVVIDTRETSSARVANYFIRVEANKDFELISALRMVINGHELVQDRIAGVDKKNIIRLADIMKTCEYGIVFVGLGMTNSGAKSNNIDNLFDLVKRLNEFTRFSVIPMRGHYNVAGFNEVMTWRSGYPFAVDYFRGYPRYNPGETTVIDKLSRGEIDAMLSISADPVAHFPRRCVEHMARIPLISIEVARTPTTELSDLIIPGVISGMEAEGTYYRMDGIPLTAKKFIEPPFTFTKSDEDTLKQIYNIILELKDDTKKP